MAIVVFLRLINIKSGLVGVVHSQSHQSLSYPIVQTISVVMSSCEIATQDDVCIY